MTPEDCGHILFVSVCAAGKNLYTPLGAAWLVRPLYWAGGETYDLQSKSVGILQLSHTGKQVGSHHYHIK